MSRATDTRFYRCNLRMIKRKRNKNLLSSTIVMYNYLSWKTTHLALIFSQVDDNEPASQQTSLDNAANFCVHTFVLSTSVGSKKEVYVQVLGTTDYSL